MRKACAALVILLLAATPAGASAAPAERYAEDSASVYCFGDTFPGLLFMETSLQSGNFAHLEVEAPGFDVHLIGESTDVALRDDRSVMSASIPLWLLDPVNDPPFGEFVGIATVSAQLTYLYPTSLDSWFRFGNTQQRIEGVDELVLSDVDVILPDQTEIVGDCYGFHREFTFFETNPALPPSAFVSQSMLQRLSCQWETADGPVFLSAFADGDQAYSDLSFGSEETSGVDEGSHLTASDYSATFSIWSLEGQVGTASASASLTRMGQIHTVERSGDHSGTTTETFIGAELSVDGILDIDLNGGLSLAMDDEHCTAVIGLISWRFVAPGPKG